ncbi:long-chain-fatty-acid--CoA ligase 1-like isoform X2 [Saccostrea cucullata]|uniref:long-chain-fatty-acid--CoA ligase 1-like isoform X2 n=1 Tax=Saccostrea cuccullata TaxID=36930 RepID=UPI002ED06B56
MKRRMSALLSDASALSIGAGVVTAVTAAAATYYLSTRPEPNILPPIDLDDQSIVLEDGTRISRFSENGKLMKYLYDDVKTTYDAFQRGLKLSGDGPCLGTRTGPNLEYVWMTYKESVTKEKNHSGDIAYVVCDTAQKVKNLLAKADQCPSLKCIIMMESPSEELKSEAAKHKIELLQYKDFLELGEKNLQEPKPPKESDLATICYTSGTTGDPKGVMLTHANLICNMSSVAFIALKAITVDKNDVHISYLPLAHMFERGMEIICFMHGCRVGFFRGDVKLLTEDMQALKPTLFITVPRLLNRIYDKIENSVQGSAFKSKLLEWAVAAKSQEVESGIVRKNSIWDKLLFGKVQKLLGGRVKIVITGSAPLEAKVFKFIRAAFGCVVMEGYGQTEATAGITFSIPGDPSIGHVGCPLPCAKVKLVDVPEMDYYAKDNKGEICSYSPSTFIGYYKNEEKTKETIDDDGWLHTGDIGQWLPNGTLKIIDRKKNIFKLSQGEYIATEKIENCYTRSRFVAQAFVDGNSLKNNVVGIIVPDPEVMPGWAKEQGMSPDMEELCKNKKVREMIFKDITKVGKEAGLKTFEQVANIHLFPELFSLENNLLTPTFKNKRPVLRKTFQPVIDELYAEFER